MNARLFFCLLILGALAGCRLRAEAPPAQLTPVVNIPTPAASPTTTPGSTARVSATATSATATPAVTTSPTAIRQTVPPSTLTATPTIRVTAASTRAATALPTAMASATTAEPTATMTLTATPAGPQILSFSVAPRRISQGDTVTLRWETAAGEQATICAIANLQAAQSDCFEAPLSGTEVVTTEPDATIYEFTLNVSNAVSQSVAQQYVCIDVSDLFFEDEQQRCGAEPPRATYAAAQRFERGLMLWLEVSDEFLVFLDDHTYYQFSAPLPLKPGASEENRVGGAPQGMEEPVSGFGLLWRGEVDGAEGLREALGWALQPEFGYDTVHQRGIETNWHPVDRFVRAPEGRVIYFFRQVYLPPHWEYVE